MKGYGHYIYMVTNRLNNMRYIGTHTGYSIDIVIDNKRVIRDISNWGIKNFKLEILNKSSDDLYLHEIVKIYIKRYLICGLYNEGYYMRGVTESTVICIETGNTYDNPAQAGKHIGIDPSNIRRALKGQRKTAGGYTWKYYKDYLR